MHECTQIDQNQQIKYISDNVGGGGRKPNNNKDTRKAKIQINQQCPNGSASGYGYIE